MYLFNMFLQHEFFFLNATTTVAEETAKDPSKLTSFVDFIKKLNESGFPDIVVILVPIIVMLCTFFHDNRKYKKQLRDSERRYNAEILRHKEEKKEQDERYKEEKKEQDELNRISIKPYLVIESVYFSQNEMFDYVDVSIKNCGVGTATQIEIDYDKIGIISVVRNEKRNYLQSHLNVDSYEVIKPENTTTLRFYGSFPIKEEEEGFITFTVKYIDMKERTYWQTLNMQYRRTMNTDKKIDSTIIRRKASPPSLNKNYPVSF